MPFEEHWKVSIIIPLEERQEMFDNPIVKKMLDVIGKAKIGNIGQYSGCFAIYHGAGGSIAGPRSNPHTGKIGSTCYGPCSFLTSYGPITIPYEEVVSFCDELAEIHPWEHPTIEIEKTFLWMPL